MLQQMALFHYFFLWLNNISLYRYTTYSLPIMTSFLKTAHSVDLYVCVQPPVGDWRCLARTLTQKNLSQGSEDTDLCMYK